MASSTVSAGQIFDRLSGFSIPEDPGRLAPADRRAWPPSWRKAAGANLRPAGVLVPVIDRPKGLTLLLTRRSADLTHHAGQVSFPGGRIEPGDADIAATALRETQEEVGIAAEHIRLAGALPTLPTITGYAVTPIVGLLPADLRLTIDPGEVDLAFEVPLEFLLNTANEGRNERVIEGVSVPLLELNYGGQRIWGATAWMIRSFREILFEQ